jgi:hypothetical protein
MGRAEAVKGKGEGEKRTHESENFFRRDVLQYDQRRYGSGQQGGRNVRRMSGKRASFVALLSGSFFSFVSSGATALSAPPCACPSDACPSSSRLLPPLGHRSEKQKNGKLTCSPSLPLTSSNSSRSIHCPESSPSLWGTSSSASES